MSSSSPLNSRPQEAVAGHDTKSGVGAVQHAAGVRSGEHHLIDRGYVPVRQLTGKVVGVWGDAHIRLLTGEVVPLHVGDVVKKGEVVLTAQDGIIQIEASHGAHTQLATAGAGDDVDRVISQVDNGEIDVQPAAGPNSGGAAGSLEEGLRVGRDAEAVTPAALDFNPLVAPPQPTERAAVTPLDNAPVANPDTETTAANTPVVFDPRTNDTASSGLTVIGVAGQPISEGHAVTLPQGTVSMNPDGTLTFTPNHNFNGSITFTYTDENGAGATSSSTVTVNVGNLDNHAPVAVADTFAGVEDTPIRGSLTGNDTPSLDGGNVWSLTTGAAHGSVTVNADGTFTYVPAPHYVGPDSFTYTITDTEGDTSTTTVTLNVAPVPLAVADTIAVSENTPSTGTLAGNDTASPDGTSTWALGDNAAHGQAVVHPDGSYSYTPNPGYHGTDTFTYTITDAAGTTSTATVTLNVAPIDPTAAPDTFAATENGSTPTLSVKTNDTPVAGEHNTWSVPSNDTAHGTITPAADFATTGNFTYTPNPGFNGTDTFTYTITNDSGHASTATVTINVAALVPAAAPDTFAATENGTTPTLSVATNDTPVAGETSTWSVPGTATAHGSITPAADFATTGNFTYTPNPGFSGTDTFTYTVTDSSGHASTATVTLNVAPVAPTAAPDTFAATENGTTPTLSVATNDSPVAGETNTWSVASNATAHGTITPASDFASTGNFTYTPNPGFSGTDTFTYTVTDGSGHASTATVTLDVAPIAPTAAPDTFAATENGTTPTLSVATNDSPVAGEANTWSVPSNNTAHGTITPASDFATTGNFTYTPNPGFSGTDTFTYTVTDGSGHASTATVTLDVAPLAPTAAPDAFAATENTATATLSVATNDSPVAGETNTWSVASNATAHGTITPAPDFATTGNFTYKPADGFVGTDTFSYTITDGSGHASTATVSISVAAIAPTAAPDTFTVVENTATGTLSVATNDAPVAGETNTWSVASNATAHGSITPAADFATTGNFTYKPADGFVGTDKFTYTITDGSGHASTATVTLTVGPIAPIATPDTFAATENGTTATLSVKTNDTPVAGEANTWSVASNNTAHGTITPAADFATTGNFTYAPAAGFSGTDTFSYTITDADGQSSTAIVTIDVAPIAPTAVADAFNATENSSSGPLSVKTNDTGVAGEANTWSVASNATAHGTITPAADFASTGNFSYKPADGFSGTDTFTYTVTDGSGHASTATVTITVAPINPAAAPDTFNATENGTSPTLSVKTNDTPVAGETNTWSVASNATAHGTITPAADFASTGNFTYKPADGFSGTDTFTYTVTDGSGHASTATVTIVVAPINPTAAPDTFSASENGTTPTLSVATNDSPVAGESNTWSVPNNNTAHGTITPAADFATTGNFTYTPNAGFSGTDTFTYTVTDGSGHASTATVTINVAPVTPIAVDDSFGATENGTTATLSVKTNDSGVAGETNTWSVASNNTAHGTITPAADFASTGNFTYTPTAGYSGPDTFTYTVTDGTGHASTATVTINVAPINPTAVADGFTAIENTATATLSVKTNDAAVAGETNTWSVASNATAHGTITPATDFASTGNFTYKPADGFIGTDTFTYTITDGTGHASTATVTITVGAINPTAAPDTFNIVENTASPTLSVATNDAPVAGETNTWSLASTTTPHGAITPASDFATTGNFTYKPADGFVGTDTFTYTITDGSGHASTATVTLHVAPVAPIATADTFAATENATTATFCVKTNDTPVAGETNTWSVASNNTAHGTITPAADFATTGNFTYTPAAGFSGADTFTYTITDTDGQTSTATVTINVAPIDPTAVADTFTATENGTTATLSVKTNDTGVAGETNTWSVASTTTAHGTITPAADFASTGNFTYTPTVGYSGPDTFTYTVTDGTGHASTATVTINVAPINPTAVADTFTATENGTTATLSVKTNDAGVAGETNTWSVASTTTSHGSITPAADFTSTGNFTYTPAAGFSGTDTFSYTVTDGTGHASTATVTITVAPIAPTAVADGFTATENGTTATLSVKANDTAVAGETNTWSVASNATAHGTITPAADFASTGNFTYTPAAGFSGTDTFSYTVTDGSGHASTATVTIEVAPINPIAIADTFTANENTSTATYSVKANDTGVAGETNTWSVASNNTAHGTIAPAADFATTGNFRYTPAVGFSGADTFTYTITDGSGHASTATVTINVAPASPVAAPDTFSASENTATSTLSVKTNDTPVGGETNTWSVASNATAHGTITPASDFASTGNFTYKPADGFIGADTFSYTITDGSGHASTTTVTINVAAINPTAAPDTFNVIENAATPTLSVKTNDSPVAGETNTWSLASTTTPHGTITPAADFASTGNFTYKPANGFVGTDTFTYTITDGSGHVSTATVTLHVAPIAPIATADSFAATENATSATFSVKTNDTPVAGETNTWSVASNATAHGTITPAADFASTGNFTYTPAAGFSGTDSFTYTITDTDGQTSTATVTITVAPINPVAVADAFNATENSTSGTLSVKTNDTPVAGETNTWSVASTTTAHGTITPASDFASTGNFTYKPADGFSGTDTFTYTVTDGTGHASTATVTITVAPINPTAAPDTFNATENASSGTLSVKTNDTPVAGETNTWSVASTNTAHGTITPAADFASTGNFTYTPTAGFSGADTFTYTITDGTGHASTATVTINVAPINPTATPDSFTATENGTTATLSVKTNDAAVAGETTTWSVASNATAHGTITPASDFASTGNFTYTPAAGFSGTDTFTYTVTDGSGHASTATVTITVAPINPIAVADSFNAIENGTTPTLSVKGNDTPVAGETNTWSVASNATAHGTITPAADFASTGNFTYKPADGFSGTDTFTYTVTDGTGHASTATVTITVAPINPTAAPDTFAASENTATGTLSVKTNDSPVAGETNTWSVASTTTAHGSITPAADFASTGNFTYKPVDGFIGTDTFTYTITDGTGHASTATVTINVAAINPTATPDAFTVSENSPSPTFSVATNDAPVAGETNTWSVASTTTPHGTITPAADFASTGKFTYTPATGYVGTDTFTYTVTDGSGHASTATVTLTVAPIAPVAAPDTFATNENATSATFSVKGNDSPVAGETNTWSVASTTTAHGSITPAADFASTGNFTYTPAAGYSGPDTFSYTITDAHGQASTATVTINVAPIAPTAAPDTFAASENATTGTLSVKTNDSPVAGETNTWSVASTTTTHGTITPASDFASTGNFTYTPTAGFSGTDTFTYTITDGSGHASTATVTLNVAAINPVAVADAFNATENATSGTLSVKTNDTPVAGETNTWSVASNNTAHGTITPASDFASTGNFTYKPADGFSGTDTFTYTITDGTGHASTATVTITVAPINPIAAPDSFNATENSTSGTLSVKTNDTPVAGEANTWSVASNNTAHGTITPAADFASTGNFTYTPASGFSGTDSFTYTVTDGSGHASTTTVTLVVAPINPTAVADSFSASENTATATLSVRTNDSPVAGETNTWSVASTTTAHGTITPAADFASTGNFTYKANDGYIGADTFTYTITDGSGHASTATVTINVAAINPTAVADAFNATENSTTGTLSVKGNDSPVAGETNTWSVASTTTPHGTITPASDFAATGNFTYTPTSGYSGTDTFTYTITDGSGHASTATVTITVAPINPVVVADAFNATENSTSGTLSVKTNDTGVAGETNTWSVASNNTAHGTITPASDFASTGNFTYKPADGFSGTDTFTYTVTDGSGHASTATVTITVAPINPTAVADAFNATENSTTGTLSVKTNDTAVAGETNTWSVASTTTTHGSITPAADFASTGNFTYTPTAGFSGTDTFTYTVTDGSGHASTATVTLTVAPINPTAVADTFTASENTATGTLSVKTNDSGVAGEANTWSVASNTTAHGTITPAADFASTGNFTYKPADGFIGTDTFSYTITDGSGHASTATVSITVAAINPTAAPDSFNVVENTATGTLSVATNDSPVAGETNTWSVASTTTPHGTITPASDFATSGKFTYTPAAGYVGTDTFTYTITDGSGHASTATVTLHVAPVAPVAAPDTFSATENASTGTLSVKTNDTPVAGETNTWSVASNATAHGTITPASDFASTGNFTYTPTAGFSGTDTFTYTITDTDGQSSTATVTINVAPINPVAVADAFNATENATSGTLSVKTNDTPVAGENNTWSVASNTTAHGTITPAANFGTTGNFTYTPTAGFSGTDTFTYTVTDGSGHASTATVTITVAPINPTAVADTFNATENSTSGTLSVKTNDTAVAGETNTWSVASTTTTHGTITPASDFASTGNFTYTPTSGFSGTDTFSYTVTDGSGHSSTATVTITVAPINPIAVADTFNATENSTTGTLSVKTNDTAVAGETNTWSVASTTTAHGTITPAADFASTGNFTYTPTSGYSGTDTFTYTVTDGSGHASTATVTLTVAPINPVAVADAFNATENSTTGTLSVKTNDTPVAGETNTWSVASNTTAHGTITPAANFGTTGNFTYTPTAGFSGTDTFTYTVTDGSGHASTATVTITVAPINPTAVADSFNATENSTSGTLSVKTNDTAVAGETNTWSVASTTTTHGTITPASDFASTGNFTYTPTAGYSGTDTFSYTVTDGSGHSSTATVTITVAPINPIAVADTFNATENSTTGTLSVKTNDTAVAGETNTWSVASTTTTHGTITPASDFASTGNFTYTPTAGYSGTDTFTYTVTDGSGHSSTATVTITVAPINPVAVADAFNATENATSGTLSVKTNDTPVAGETNTWSVASNTTAHGTITPAANFGTTGNFTYTPTTGFSGTDTFTYTITDTSGHTSTATVTINVAPINPTAVADAFNATENSTTGTLSVKTNDTAVAGETNTWSVATAPAHGTITPASDFASTGNFTYTPTAGYSGTDTFTYTVTDGSGHASTATVTLTVAPINPIAVADAFNVNESTSSGTLSVKANDTPVAGETNTWSVASNTTAHGTITPASDFATTGNFTYTPTAGYVGTDTFTYTITDGSGHASTATVTLTVAAINPTAVNDTYTTNEDTPLAGTVITNDSPVAGETNTWSVTANPTHGSLVLAADFATSGKFTYTPTANYSGTDTFTYKITDTTGHTSTATATITIVAVADAPTLTVTDKTYYAATNFDEVTLSGSYGDVLVTGLGSGAGSTTTTHAGTWQTGNGGNSVEIGTGATYGIKNADGTSDTSKVIELEQNPNDASNLFTTMTTKVGEVYTLNFDYAARASSEQSSVIYVYWEGQLVDTLNTQSPTMQHTTLQLISTTNGGGKLEFVAGDSNSFGGVLDNITLGLSTDTGVQGYAVNLPSLASSLVDTDNSETLKTIIDTIPVGATLTDGTHTFTSATGATTADVSGWTLGNLSMTSPTAGDFTLGVHSTSTETSNGSTATSNATVTVHVLDDTAGVYGTAGNDTLTITDATASVSGIRWGLDGNDSIVGSIGHDTLMGGAGNDTLRAGAGAQLLDGGIGNDSLVAGTGADTLSGGQGNDTMTAGTGAVSDVFKWHLGDAGSEGTATGHAAIDTIINFDAGKASAGGDILDLRDLLVGENAGATTQPSALTHYMDFDTTTTAGSTIIHISSHGDFASGYAAANEDQTIVLQGVDLRSSMGLAANSTDAQVISELLNRGKLITDGQ